MRLIDADVLKAVFIRADDDQYYTIEVKNVIDNSPSINVPLKFEGEWILNAKPWLATEGQCSVCKARAHLIFGVKYCPNCGAKMKGEAKK